MNPATGRAVPDQDTHAPQRRQRAHNAGVGQRRALSWLNLRSHPGQCREMSSTEPPAYPEREIEELIGALTGVLAARVAVSMLGRIEEIHVLADEQLHPKQIVRNIESALSAGLGVTVDRRLVSVAQVRGAEAEAFAADELVAADIDVQRPAAPLTEGRETHDARETHDVRDARDAHDAHDASIATRYVFVGYDARTRPDLESTCRVTIRHGNEAISGTGTGPSTPLGRAQAAARAVFAAIAAARRDHTLGFEGATLIDSHERGYVLVSAHANVGRQAMPLTGIAALLRSPEEAAILASLQATNRWAEFDG